MSHHHRKLPRTAAFYLSPARNVFKKCLLVGKLADKISDRPNPHHQCPSLIRSRSLVGLLSQYRYDI